MPHINLLLYFSTCAVLSCLFSAARLNSCLHALWLLLWQPSIATLEGMPISAGALSTNGKSVYESGTEGEWFTSYSYNILDHHRFIQS
jgi:hypothetical protein